MTVVGSSFKLKKFPERLQLNIQEIRIIHHMLTGSKNYSFGVLNFVCQGIENLV
jgi:hypothetical protein